MKIAQTWQLDRSAGEHLLQFAQGIGSGGDDKVDLFLGVRTADEVDIATQLHADEDDRATLSFFETRSSNDVLRMGAIRHDRILALLPDADAAPIDRGTLFAYFGQAVASGLLPAPLSQPA
ncbi:hypothetical protein R0381_002697 [Jeongeupia wiesaeckerbachi]|uniref:hypothetical protein n=1 Tax=Jeongeupia wiesaeckerbachi TaxID=3051218 RepID=UPI003D8018C3